MSIEIALLVSLGVVTLALFVLIGVLVWVLKAQDKREIKYINWILARSVREFTKAQQESTKEEGQKLNVEVPANPYYPESELSDDEFFEKIKDINRQSGVS